MIGNKDPAIFGSTRGTLPLLQPALGQHGGDRTTAPNIGAGIEEITALRRNSWWTPFSLGFRDLGLLASSRFDGFGSESSPPFMGIFGESWCPLLAR
jgi:hypothetical protein